MKLFRFGTVASLAVFASAADAVAQSPPSSLLSQAPPESVCTTCGKPNGIPAAIPPAGFNPLTATDRQLDHYGFPPRPDPRKAPGDYAVWQTMVTTPVKRVIPRQQMTTLANGPAVILSTSQGLRPPVTTKAVGATTPNWSGYGIIDSANPFKASNSTIYGVFMVPVAQQAAGTCSGGWDYSAAWVGFDGLNSKDLLQAGVEADAYCASGSTRGQYYAWYEWYPNNEVRVSAPTIAPGNVIYVYVWNTGLTTGHYYIQNMTTRVSSSLQFSAPSGTQLQGNSMEWIVERTQVGGSYATLTNYTGWPWYDARAVIPGTSTLTYDPAYAPTGAIYSITMLDNAGGAISYGETTANSGYTYVDPQGKVHHLLGTGLWFFDEGSAK